MKFFVSLLRFVGVIFLFLAGFLLIRRYLPATPSFNVTISDQQSSAADSQLVPTRLEIPDLNISLPVTPATITDGKWETTRSGVSFLTSSSAPGTRGNSVFYGHNTPALLGKLSRVKPGQEVNVVRQDGSQITYTVQFTAIVTPNQTHILDQTEDDRLTIFTCAGLFDQKRFVAVATKSTSPVILEAESR